MRQVIRFCLKDFNDRDFASLYNRSTLLKLRKICVFEIDRNFDRKLQLKKKQEANHMC